MKKDESEPVTKSDEPSDYDEKSERASGMAITHEQATDTYTEGTIDGDIEHGDGSKEPLKRPKR